MPFTFKNHCWVLKKNLVDFKYDTEELKFLIFNPQILLYIFTQMHIKGNSRSFMRLQVGARRC